MLVDLLKRNTLAAAIAGLVAAGGIVYVIAAPGSLGSGFPDRFMVVLDGKDAGVCDLTIDNSRACNVRQNRDRNFMITRHAGDPSKVKIERTFGPRIEHTFGDGFSNVSWSTLEKGITLSQVTRHYGDDGTPTDKRSDPVTVSARRL